MDIRFADAMMVLVWDRSMLGKGNDERMINSTEIDEKITVKSETYRHTAPGNTAGSE